MPNGKGLLGGASSTQGVFIIPMPEHDSLYYVFTLDEAQDSLKKGLNYSIVDMCLECGKGDVLPNFKNIHLLDSAGEKMAATYHSNGADIWIVVHQYYTDAFYAYLLTKNGLSKQVVSHIGAKHVGFNGTLKTVWGQMKISPNGKKIALGLSYIDTVTGSSGLHELFDFDNNTGEVSNEIQLSKYYYYTYGVAFSSDNSKLYMACISPLTSGIFQYDLSLSDPRHSDTLISYPESPAGLQLAPDGKIYFTNWFHRHYLSCISKPNVQGMASDCIADAVLLGSKYPDLGMPSFIDNFVYHNKGRHCGRNQITQDTALCNGTVYKITPSQSSTGYLWQDGSTDSVYVVTKSGIYSVQFTTNGGCKETYTSDVTYISNSGGSLPKDTILCYGNVYDISLPVVKGLTYTWSDGSHSNSKRIEFGGRYYVTQNYNGCTNTDTFSLIVDSLNLNLGGKVELCKGSSYKIDESGKGNKYLWSNGSTAPAITIASPGKYWLTITKDECVFSDTVTVKFDSSYANSRFLPNDTSICQGQSIMLSIDSNNGRMLWSDGSVSHKYLISKGGTYTATLTNACGSFSESTLINEVDCSCPLYIPSAFTPNTDTLNSVFNIVSRCAFINFNLKIYNRWGELVFSTNDSKKGWDGKFKGSVCDDGIYLWILHGKNILNNMILKYGKVALLN